jgi:hypothetical protein
MSRCRRCRTPKWKGDPCSSPDCPTNLTATMRITSVTKPVTVTAKHGFHAPTTTMGLVSDYDAPIRARSWRSIS